MGGGLPLAAAWRASIGGGLPLAAEFGGFYARRLFGVEAAEFGGFAVGSYLA